jgi:serine/threonine-protein kinase
MVEELPLQIGRYVLYDEIASGGMAKVHLGRAQGALGFSKIVAIKRILPHLLGEQEFVDMFVDETRVAARIQHPNVVSTLDAVVTDREVFLVMELVLGEPVSRLLRTARKRREAVPAGIAVAIIAGVLRGLHAAHDAKNDNGESLGVVHRDVSPQNIIVGIDGVARIIDFGVAKARGRLQTTRDGRIKGKMAYMSPEQLSGHEPDLRTDVYATAVILWEALAGRRLHKGDNDAIVYSNVMHSHVPRPGELVPNIPPALDAAIMCALARDARMRFQSAEEMVRALEAAVHPASPTVVGEWVRSLAGAGIDTRAARIAEIERGVHLTTLAPLLSVKESGSYPQISSERSAPDQSASVAYNATRSMTNAPPQRSSRVLTAVIVLAIAASLMATALVVVMVKRPALLGVAPPAAQAAQPIATPPATAAPPTVANDPPPAPPAADDPPPSPGTADPVSESSVPAASVKPAAPPAHPGAKLAPPKPAKPSCDPPWFLDAKGIKRFKPECM